MRLGFEEEEEGVEKRNVGFKESGGDKFVG